MKYSTLNLHKTLIFIALAFVFYILYLIWAHSNLNTKVASMVLMLPPTIFLLIKLYKPNIIIPRPFILIFFGLSIEMLTCPIRGNLSIRDSSLYGFILAVLFSFLFIKSYRLAMKPHFVAAYLIIGICFLNVPARIIDFKSTLGSLPDNLIHILGIVTGLLLYQRKKIVRVINISVSVLLVLFIYFYGYGMWYNKIDYGTFTGEVYKIAPTDLKLTDINNNTVSLKKGKITIMDLWFVQCGPCFEAFPEFQKCYDKYKNNPKLQFYTVNQPTKGENIAESFAILKKRGYTFPMATAGYDNTMIKALSIHSFPTTIVIDQQGHVIYEGNTQGAIVTVNNYINADNSLEEEIN